MTDQNKMLRGWYIKHPNAEKCIVYFHENAGSTTLLILDIGGRLYYVNYLLANANANVLLVAYRGFSDSDGDSKPS